MTDDKQNEQPDAVVEEQYVPAGAEEVEAFTAAAKSLVPFTEAMRARVLHALDALLLPACPPREPLLSRDMLASIFEQLVPAVVDMATNSGSRVVYGASIRSPLQPPSSVMDSDLEAVFGPTVPPPFAPFTPPVPPPGASPGFKREPIIGWVDLDDEATMWFYGRDGRRFKVPEEVYQKIIGIEPATPSAG